ncbi:MAG: hypothetical protein ACW99F_14440 [Candidatus Hodarchaeales archaeon]
MSECNHEPYVPNDDPRVIYWELMNWTSDDKKREIAVLLCKHCKLLYWSEAKNE